VIVQLRDRLQGGFDIVRELLIDGFKHFFLTWSWISLCSKEKISLSFAWFSSDKAWLEDASSPFSAAKSFIVNEELGGDAT
jgi:hypothetical protein